MMNFFAGFRLNRTGYILAIFLIMTHLPFLTADPDLHISIGRDAHTDEGLYSYQVRNFINYGDWTLGSSDCLLKTPLFELALFAPLKLFGTKRIVARVFVLLISITIFILALSGSKTKSLAWIMAFVTLSQYYVFNYLHYSMSDTLATLCVFGAAISLCYDRIKISGIVPAVLVSVAYFIKIQYLLMVFFVPLTLIIFLLFKLTDKAALFSRLKQSFFVLAGFFLLYFTCWYLPNQELFHFVMTEQTENRFPEIPGLLNQLNNNFRFIFLDEKIQLLTWIFGAVYIAGFVIFFRNSSSIYRKLFCSVSLWILFESHKLFMTYLPSRYLVSLLFANGFLASLILWEVLKEKRWESPVFRIPAIFLLVIITTYNAFTWYQTYSRRIWEMEKAEEYLLQYDFKGRHIAGAWATATAWKCKAITFPVWNDYFNYTNVLSTWKPVMVIAEDDEGDTGGAFISDGITLNQVADSVKTFQVNHWNLNFYWIKK